MKTPSQISPIDCMQVRTNAAVCLGLFSLVFFLNRMIPRTITTRNWTTGSSRQKWAEAVCSPSRPTKRTRRNMQTWRPSSKTVSPTWAWRNLIMVGLASQCRILYCFCILCIFGVVLTYCICVFVLWCFQFCVVVNGKEFVGLK